MLLEQALLENALELLLEVNQMKSLTKQIEQLVLNEENVERRHLLGKLATCINMNVVAEDRDKDPLWFDGKLGKLSVAELGAQTVMVN